MSQNEWTALHVITLGGAGYAVLLHGLRLEILAGVVAAYIVAPLWLNIFKKLFGYKDL